MAYLKIKKRNLHLQKQIGVGGFSAVFKAKLNGQYVAAKQLHEPDQHEVEVLFKLDHPNIVKFIGICDDPDNFTRYLVLELCRGGSLRSYLDLQRSQEKWLPKWLIYDWAKQAAKPIQYLSQMKIVHKDVKSPNYLIAEGNVLKLADFGLAKKNVESTIQGATHRSSAQWMAPELEDDILSPTYDIFAYGVVVWELMTTEFPYEGSQPLHVKWRVCSNDERPVIPSDCPKPLADLMRQCWEKDWKKRPTIDHILMVLTSANQKFLNFINRSWVLEKEFGQNEPGKLDYAMGIAVSPTGQIAVADQDKKSARTHVYSAEGQHQISIDTTQGLMPWTTSYPNNVAVSSTGDYYVADVTRFVKAFDSSGMYKGKWVAVSPDNKPSDTEDTAYT